MEDGYKGFSRVLYNPGAELDVMLHLRYSNLTAQATLLHTCRSNPVAELAGISAARNPLRHYGRAADKTRQAIIPPLEAPPCSWGNKGDWSIDEYILLLIPPSSSIISNDQNTSTDRNTTSIPFHLDLPRLTSPHESSSTEPTSLDNRPYHLPPLLSPYKSLQCRLPLQEL